MTRGRSRAAALLLLGALPACTVNLARVQAPPRSLAVTTTGPWASMIYLLRTDSGVAVIDLGWVGAEGRLRRALREMGASPEDVRAVFLTHTHRDHIVGWRLLRGADFHLAGAEVDPFLGRVPHRGTVPRLAQRLWPADRPEPGELRLRPFPRDTLFVVGGDTVRAYVVPGHTAGSAAYLADGVLFVGDALSWSPLTGFRPDRPVHSDDSALSRASVDSLWARLPAGAVRWVCTAHAKCAPFGEKFRAGARR